MSPELIGLYVHTATGCQYLVIGSAFRSTNDNAGTDVVYYNSNGILCTRDVDEFFSKNEDGNPRFTKCK
jgi:hypothetical protein